MLQDCTTQKSKFYINRRDLMPLCSLIQAGACFAQLKDRGCVIYLFSDFLLLPKTKRNYFIPIKIWYAFRMRSAYFNFRSF